MASGRRPHVVLVVADDMGYSDLGCYGGEVATPTLDRLGRAGVRLSRFYNTARCSPSRASLLTGLHPHQTGLGILTNDDRPQGYPGSLNRRCVTLAEMLRQAGYATCLSGKWHLASEVWTTLRGVADAAGLRSLLRHAVGLWELLSPDHAHRAWRTTSSARRRRRGSSTPMPSREEAEAFVRAQGSREPGRPFFLYTAYTAPHWPLHAPPDDIARYRGVSMPGGTQLRETRLQPAGGRGDHAGRHDAERSRSEPARVAGCAAPRVAARADAGVRRADRPDGSRASGAS